MTVMQNALHSFGSDWSWVPPRANTIGPREVLGARHRSFWLDGDLGGGVSWQRFIARLVAHGPVSEFVPGSVLQTARTDYTILGSVADDVRSTWREGLARDRGAGWSPRRPLGRHWRGWPSRRGRRWPTPTGWAGLRCSSGCGTGEFCALGRRAAPRSAGSTPVWAMFEVARRRFTGRRPRVARESLPWDDGTFEVVTAFIALQFAASFDAAVAEAARVTRPGGLLAVCNWGAPGDLAAVYAALSPGDSPPPAPLEERIGLPVVAAADVEVPYESPGLGTLCARSSTAPGSTPPARRSSPPRRRSAAPTAPTASRTPSAT